MPRSRCGSATRCSESRRGSSRAREAAQVIEERDVGDLVHQTTTDGADPGVRVEDEGQVGLRLGRASRDAGRVRVGDHDPLVFEHRRPVDPGAGIDQLIDIGDHHPGSGSDLPSAPLEIHRPRPEDPSKLDGVIGSRPSTTASASDTATRDTGTRRSEPSPRKRKTTLPHGTAICGVHSSPCGTRSTPRHQPRRAQSPLNRWLRNIPNRPRTPGNEPHRQPRRLLWSEPQRPPRSPPSGLQGQSRRARSERSKRPLVTARGRDLGSATACRTHERTNSSPPPASHCSR